VPEQHDTDLDIYTGAGAWKSLSPEAVDQLKSALLIAYVRSGSLTRACQATSISQSAHRRWLANDSQYAEAWADAQAALADSLEEEAIRRARDGIERPVFQGGLEVGRVTEYSDQLLMFLLKGMRPEKYRDRVAVINETSVEQEIARLEEELKKRGIPIDAMSREVKHVAED
jgi:Bacteriophage Sf6, terminase small subunit-like